MRSRNPSRVPSAQPLSTITPVDDEVAVAEMVVDAEVDATVADTVDIGPEVVDLEDEADVAVVAAPP